VEGTNFQLAKIVKNNGNWLIKCAMGCGLGHKTLGVMAFALK